MSGASYGDCEAVSAECPVEATLYGYRPSLGVTAMFAAIFAINLLVSLGFMVYSRLWTFQAWFTAGVLFEVIGYIGRLMMRNDPWR